MSTKAILKIDGKYYNLLNVTYAYRRFTDYSGYVSNLIRFEKINIVISNPADTFFLQWMFNPTLQKSGTISFYDEEDMAKKVKEIVFAGAYCIEYEEKFQSTSGNPFHAFVTLSAGGVKVEESTFRFPWFKGPLIASNDSPIEAIVVEYLQNEESPINVPLQGITHTKNIATNNTPKTSTKAPVSINFSKGLQDKIGELNPTSQTLLSKDLSENVDLLKSFEDNHDLVDSWKVLDDLVNNGENSFAHLKNDPDFLKKFDEIAKDSHLNDHLFKGHVKKKFKADGTEYWDAGGVHSIIAINNGNAAYTGQLIPVGPIGAGYYTSKIKVYNRNFPQNQGWKAKGSPSTFFPDSWSKEKIQCEITKVLIENNSPIQVKPDGRKLFGGAMSDGVELNLWKNSNGGNESAFPVL